MVTALSIMKGDFNMKDLRNPLNRTENFEHPSGNVMKELSESDLNSFSAGAGETRASSGIACTLTAECNIGTHIMLFGKLNAAFSVRLKRVFQST